MRDAAVITITLVIAFLIIGYAYNLASPYLVKLGVIEKSAQPAVLMPDGGIFRSEDFGRTWTQTNVTLEDAELEKSDVFGLEFLPTDARTIYAATSEGLFISENSANSWRNATDKNIVSADEEIVAVALDPKNPQRMYFASSAAGKRSRILKTKGAGFYAVYSAPETETKITGLWIDSFDPSVIYAGTSKGLLLISRDFGESWGILHEFTASINDLFMLPSDTRVFFLAAGGIIFKSFNQGNTFEKIWSDAAATLISDLAIDPYNESVIYAATSRGLFRSSDSGSSFSEVKLPIAAQTPNISSVYAPQEKKNMLLLGSDAQIYKSDDAGFTWQIKDLSTSRRISIIKVKPGDLRVIFAGVKN